MWKETQRKTSCANVDPYLSNELMLVVPRSMTRNTSPVFLPKCHLRDNLLCDKTEVCVKTNLEIWSSLFFCFAFLKRSVNVLIKDSKYSHALKTASPMYYLCSLIVREKKRHQVTCTAVNYGWKTKCIITVGKTKYVVQGTRKEQMLKKWQNFNVQFSRNSCSHQFKRNKQNTPQQTHINLRTHVNVCTIWLRPHERCIAAPESTPWFAGCSKTTSSLFMTLAKLKTTHQNFVTWRLCPEHKSNLERRNSPLTIS